MVEQKDIVVWVIEHSKQIDCAHVTDHKCFGPFTFLDLQRTREAAKKQIRALKESDKANGHNVKYRITWTVM